MIAENSRSAIKYTSRRKNMRTRADCFTGSDFISHLVNENHAASRADAVILGRALQDHLSLFLHVSNESQLLQDDSRSFYRFNEEINEMKSFSRSKTM